MVLGLIILGIAGVAVAAAAIYAALTASRKDADSKFDQKPVRSPAGTCEKDTPK